MNWSKIAWRCAGAALVATLLSSPAAADVFMCQKGCVIDPAEGWLEQDYTIPTNGQRERWDFWFENAPADLKFRFQPPSQVDGYLTRRLADGTFSFDEVEDFTWEMTSYEEPNHIWYIVNGPTSYDRCSDTSPVGEICGASYTVWGNGTYLEVSGSGPFIVFSRITAIPEPATWAMMIAGFGLAGAALRRQGLVVA